MNATGATGAAEGARRAGVVARVRRSTWTWLLVGLAVSAGLLWLAVRDIDFDTFLGTLEDADAAQVAVATVLICLPWAVIGLRWRIVARRMNPPPAPRMIGLVFMGAAVNNCLPGRLGDIARAIGLGRDTRRPVTEALGTTIVDRIADIVFFAACFAGTSLLFPHEGWLVWVGVGTVLLVAGALVLCAAIVVGARRGRAARGRLGRWLAPHLQNLSRGLTAVRTPRAVGGVAAYTVLAWGCLFAGYWLAARSVGIDLGPAQVVFLTTVISLGTALPSLPGFVGTFHWVASTVLQMYGVPASEALAVAVVLHALGFLPTTVIGLPIMLREGLGLRTIRAGGARDAAGV